MRWTDLHPTRQSGLQVCSQSPTDELLSCGSTKDLYIQEHEFSTLHPFYKDSYIEHLLESLPFPVTRLRWMSLAARGCYSFHKDLTWRLHIPIITSHDAFFLFRTPSELHTLEEGVCYKVDTTKTHTALNTSLEERVHLVGCIYE
ncbi:aspartyl/asparaginyl beta-hydroxylase domain-containing protein [bacterium]|nr:aspartyl/asparaginyl beta-hydroxylase domain-containing protein [bacterium]